MIALRAVVICALMRLAACVVALIVVMTPASAAGEDERRVKAVFLYKFIPYVSWPPSVATDDPFVIAATDAQMARELEAVTRGRRVNGKAIAVRHLREGDRPADVHLLFVSEDEAGRLPGLVNQSRGRPVLVVSEVEGGLDRGAVINFVISEGRVRFEVALPAAESRGLAVSSRLLKVAEHVRTGSP